MLGIFKKIFGTAQGRLIKKYSKLVKKINEAEAALQPLTDEQVKAKTQEFKERLAKGESLNDLLIEAYAVVKNTCRRLMRNRRPRFRLQSKMGHDPLRCPDSRRDLLALWIDC